MSAPTIEERVSALVRVDSLGRLCVGAVRVASDETADCEMLGEAIRREIIAAMTLAVRADRCRFDR